MRVYLVFTALLASLAVAPFATIHADDDLLSQLTMESVFEKTVTKSDTDLSAPQRITSSKSLTSLLEKADFEVEQDEQRVSIETKYSDWEFPFYFAVDLAKEQVSIELPVVKISQHNQADSAKLLELFAANDNTKQMYFSYSRDLGNVRLRHTISNRNVTPESLKKIIQTMSAFAESHSDAWSNLVTKTSATKPTGQTSKAPKSSGTKAVVAVAPKLTLLGSWSASVDANQAFAIRIEKDNRFQLVHLQSGKAQTSVGTLARRGDQLTLSGDDKTKIVGTVVQTSSDAFQLNVQGADGKVALTLKFKRSGK